MYPRTLYVKEVRVSSMPPSPSNSNGILPKFATDKTKCKGKVILKDALKKTLGSDVSNKGFRIKLRGTQEISGRNLAQLLFVNMEAVLIGWKFSL